jgi:hypothetical protein
MAVSLKKEIEPGSDRWNGLQFTGFTPSQLPIAGTSRQAIVDAMDRKAMAIGRINPDNAFVVREQEQAYLYVRPEYTGYRRLAFRRFGHFPADRDVDHVFARHLAGQTACRFVLVALVAAHINRKHGLYERLRLALDSGVAPPPVSFVDARILDKILGRDSETRRRMKPRDYQYQPGVRPDLGLTLKQRGIWNVALGFHTPAPQEFLASLRPIA